MRLPALFLLTLSATAIFGCDSGIVDPTVAGDGSLAAKGGGPDLTAPSNATASSASQSRIDVAWVDNSSNESGFEVHRSTDGAAGTFTLRGTWGANTVLHVDTGLEAGREFCYRVRTTRKTGTKVSYSPFSNIACATTAAIVPPPAAPTSLIAIGTSETQIDLTWEDQSSDESSFVVYRSSNGAFGPFLYHLTTVANSVAHTDGSLFAGRVYCYYVVAVRATAHENGTSFVYSEKSNTACASPIPPPPPPPPTSPPPSAYVVGAAPASSSMVAVSVTWTDASTAPSYRLYRSLDGTSSWELLASGGYNYFSADSERTVCYRAVAYNAAGDSEPSTAVCVVPPAGPTNLVATPVDATTLELTWSDNSSVETGYEVWGISRWRSNCFDAGYEEFEYKVAALPANTASWRASRHEASCHNSGDGFYVVATRDGGRSDPSFEVSAVSPAP